MKKLLLALFLVSPVCAMEKGITEKVVTTAISAGAAALPAVCSILPRSTWPWLLSPTTCGLVATYSLIEYYLKNK